MSTKSRQLYKTQELLALRDSVSETAVTLEKFGDDDAIKEHVLRPSASSPGLAPKCENLHPSNTTANACYVRSGTQQSTFITGTVKKPSPTPSMKRGKAHQMIKEHGSPPGFRVTAGGRIVPSDFSSLGGSHYPQSRQQHQKDMVHNAFTQNFQEFSTPNGYVDYNFRGQLCQSIDGNMLPLQQGPQGPVLLTDPLNYPCHCLPGFSAGNAMGPPLTLPQLCPPSNGTLSREPTPDPHTLFMDHHIQNLKNQYAVLERQKLEHEREEVRIKDTLLPQARTQMIDRKRQLTTSLDYLRKQIKLLEVSQLSESGHAANPSMVPRYDQIGHVLPTGYPPTIPAMYRAQPAFLPPPTGYPAYSNEDAPQIISITNSLSEPTPLVVPSAEDVRQVYTRHQPPACVSDSNVTAFALDEQSRNFMSHLHVRKHSHAIEIKDPRNNGQNTERQSSTLDPTSPVYEPGKPITTETDNVQSPSPLSLAEGIRLRNRESSAGLVIQQSKENNDDIRRGLEYSMSSATTTDFFPTNAHEHSFNKFIARKVPTGDGTPTNRVDNSDPFPTTPSSVGYSYGTTLPSPDSSSELAHPKAPQTSPVDDYRVSSFVRDINPIAELPLKRVENRDSSVFTEKPTPSKHSPSMSRKSGQQEELNGHISPKRSNHASKLSHRTLPDFSCDTEGNQEYMEGYFFGITGQAPGLDRSQSFRRGFMDGFRNQVHFHQSTNRSISNVSLKSGRFSSKQLPNTASPSFDDAVDIRSNPHMTVTDTSIMTSPRHGSENMRFIDRSMASCTPTKQIDLGPSPQKRVQLSSSFQVSGNEQRVFSSGQQFHLLDTSKGILTAEEVEKRKGEITPQIRTLTNHHGSMDGAVDCLIEAAVSKSPTKAKISSTATRTYQLKPSVSPPESITQGCSPRCFSPSKRLQNLLHGSSRMDREKETKGVRSPSPDPAHMKPDEKREWKQKWANRFRELKHKEDAEIQEYKAKNPLPDNGN